jgi:hypothetical protein
MKRLYFLCFALMFFGIQISAQNYALRFFGNGVSDIDRVKIPIDNPEKNADVGFNFTIEFQMKADLDENPLGYDAIEGNNDDWVLGHVIVDRDIFGPGDNGDYGISLADGRIAFGLNNGDVSYTIIGNSTVADGTWKHIAVTRNSTSGEIAIFVNGELDKSAISGVTGDISYRNGRDTDWQNDPYIVLGAEKHDYDNNFYPSYNGYLDELRISNIVRYNDAYTPQIVFTDDEYTVALYHFDEGDGNVLNDFAQLFGNNSDGIIMYGGSPFGPVWELNDMEASESVEISVIINPPDAGFVTGHGLYNQGDQIELFANTNQAYTFLHWSEDGVYITNDNPLFFEAQQNRTITAEFEISTHIDIIKNKNIFSIFPNPSYSIVNISSNTTFNQIFEVKIYTVDYKLMDYIIFDTESSASEKKIDISEYQKGILIFEIIYENNKETHKIVLI